jgi:hypothetical protein
MMSTMTSIMMSITIRTWREGVAAAVVVLVAAAVVVLVAVVVLPVPIMPPG